MKPQRHDQWTIAAQCQGKDRLTSSQARTIAKRMKRAGRTTGAYRCTVCGEWHVGRMSDSRIKRVGL